MPFTPRFEITDAIAADIALIERARGFLDAAMLSDEWVRRMQEQALVREAHYSTHIEGTQLTLEQSERVLAGQDVPDADANDKQEVLNYRDAFELVATHLGDGAPVTPHVIFEVHRRLLRGVRGDSPAIGRWRDCQVRVAGPGGRTVYLPPPPEEVPGLMADFLVWLNAEKTMTPILVAGVAQHAFVDIHPFEDGNGRTARLLSTLCLYRAGYDFKRLFTISEYYDRDRPAYYSALQTVRDQGMDLTPWLEYFTHGLADQMREIRAVGERVIAADLRARELGLSSRQQRALEYVMEHGELTIRDYERLVPATPRRTLQYDLKQLVEKGVLVAEGATHRVRYRARPRPAP